jgi:DNA gyrase subunit A
MIPGLEEGEKVVNTITVSEFTDDRYLLFCTRNGTIKKTSLASYGNVRNRGIKAIKLDEGDEIIETGITDGKDEIIIATKDGQAARFDETEVRPTGRDTMGVRGMNVALHDQVVSMAVVKAEDLLLTVTENGFGKISTVDDYRKTHRGGKGVITIKTTKKNGAVVSVRRVNDDDELMVISKSGKVIRIAVDTIRKTGRNAQGVKIMELKDDDVVVSMVPVVKTDSDAPAAETQTQQ